jgi:hypothetical protein
MTRDDILEMAKEAAHPYENAIFASLWGEYWAIKFASFVAAACVTCWPTMGRCG